MQHHYIKSNLHQIAFVLPEISDRKPESSAVAIITKAFTIGNNSRLYQRLYLKEKLVDSIKVHSISGIHDGIMIILVQPLPKADKNKIIQVFIDELNELNKYGLDTIEIEKAKNELLNTSGYVYEYMEGLAQALANEEILDDYQTFFNYENDIIKVTEDDIRKQIDEYFNIDKLHICTNLNNIKNINLIDSHNINTFYLNKPSKNQICGISLAIKSSQLNENKSCLGINQLTSTMLLYGNQNMSYNQIIDFCAMNGIQFSISCGKETTKLKIKCFKKHLYQALVLLRDVLYTPLFQEHHIDNLKNSIISNITKRKEYPQYEAVHLFKEMMFGKYSNLVSKEGNINVIKKANKKTIYNWYINNIINASKALVIVGDIDVEQTDFWVKKLFDNEPNIEHQPLHKPIIDKKSLNKKIIIDKKQDQSIINLGGFCMPGKQTELRASMAVLSQIIGGDINSRMYNLLREKHGIAYSAEFDYDLLQDIGYYDMFTIVDKGKENIAINILTEIQNDIINNGVKQDELIRAKNYLIGQSRLDDESLLSQAQIISSLIVLGYDYDFYINRENRISNVNNDSIIYLARNYLKQHDQFLHVFM